MFTAHCDSTYHLDIADCRISMQAQVSELALSNIDLMLAVEQWLQQFLVQLRPCQWPVIWPAVHASLNGEPVEIQFLFVFHLLGAHDNGCIIRLYWAKALPRGRGSRIDGS